jgi:acyl-phosphate glycerol 3-phosphate acyltransferase
MRLSTFWRMGGEGQRHRHYQDGIGFYRCHQCLPLRRKKGRLYFDHGQLTLTIPIGPLNFVIAGIVPCVVGAMSMIGHSKSVFLNFTGGKSAATGLGTITALNPAVGGSVFVVFVSLVYFTRLVSLASISAGVSDVMFMALFKAPPAFIVYAAFGGLLVIIRHKANIQRLLNGTEPRFGEKAKDKEPESG